MALDFSVLERAPTIAQGFLAGQQAAQQQAEQNRLRDLQMLQMEAQRENILAQRSQREQELRERQSAEAARNALATALAKGGDEAELIKLGPAGIEAATKLAALNKARGEVFTQRMTAARQFLDTLDPNDPTAPQRYLQWHEANHRDPIIGPMLAARGITADQARSRIEQAVQQGPQALANLIAQSKLGTEKFIEMNAPKFFTQSLGGTERIVSTPGLGGAAQVVPGSVAVKTMAPGEAERIRNEGLRIGLEGRRVAVQEENARRDADPQFQQRMAAARATGDAIAKGDVAAQRALPQIISRAEEGVRLIDELIGARDDKGRLVKGARPHPGFENAVGATWLPGVRFVPGTDAAGFMARFDQIKGQSFLEAFESLKGGGAITEKEGAKGTDAINRMSIATDEREFIAAARDLQNIIRKGVENARRKTATPGAVGAPATAPNIDALLDKYR